jgi:hypothetical protein
MQVNVKPIAISDLPIVGWSVPTKIFANPKATKGKSLVVMVGVIDWGAAQGWSAPLTDLRGLIFLDGDMLYHRYRGGANGNPVIANPMYGHFPPRSTGGYGADRGTEHPRHIRERVAAMPAKMSLRRLNYAVDELLGQAIIAANQTDTVLTSY